MDFIENVKNDILNNNAKNAVRIVKSLEDEITYWIYTAIEEICNRKVKHIISYTKEKDELLCVEEMEFPLTCSNEDMFKEFIYRCEAKIKDYVAEKEESYEKN